MVDISIMSYHNIKEIDYSVLSNSLAAATSLDELQHAIVESPFKDPLVAVQLGLGTVVLLKCDYEAGTLNRVAISNNEIAKGAMRVSKIPFHKIKIPLDYTKNILIEAINTNTPQTTSDWKTLFSPILKPAEARINQAAAGVGTSVVYPLRAESSKQPCGALIFSYFEPVYFIQKPHADFMMKYSDLVRKRLAEC